MSLSAREQDELRVRIFSACERLVEQRGGYASRDELVNFELFGERVGLIDRNRGIRNPSSFNATLSIVSSHDGPYQDHVGADGLFRYSFAKGAALEGDNRKMMAALDGRVPIIVFEKPLPNVYVPVLPAYVVEVDRDRRFFLIATSGESLRSHDLKQAGWLEKKYVEQQVQRRVHQPVFRAQVLVAYERTCTICRLRHAELLDAAHIIPDSLSDGIAAVTNGLALCKIHHSAYDHDLIGIDADYRVHVNAGLLDEVDGPMLKHGIQEMDGVTIATPKRSAWMPSRRSLAVRFEQFTRN